MRKTGGVCLMSVLLLTPVSSFIPGRDQQTEPKVSADENAARLKELLGRTGERVRKFQEDLFSLKWTRVYSGQRLNADLTPKGRPVESVAEWIVLRPSVPDGRDKALPVAVIEVKSVDGKAPKGKNVGPSTYSHPLEFHHPLVFLSPEKQAEWDFSWEGEKDLRGSKTVVITATPAVVTEPTSKIKGRSFYVQGLRQRARVWIDPQSCDVLQVEWRLLDTFRFKIEFGLNWYGPFFVARPGREVEFEKMDNTIRFAPITFKDPDQILMLPVFEEYMHVIRGARRSPAYRSTVSYIDYKRFVTDVKVKTPDQN